MLQCLLHTSVGDKNCQPAKTAMDVIAMEVDAETEEGDDCEAAMVNLLECLLPDDLLVTIVQDHDIQAQWAAFPFLMQLFRAQDPEKIREYYTHSDRWEEIQDVHRQLWPGHGLPQILVSKHESKEDTAGQGVFLKHKSMPTSFAVSWLAWAVSNSKRMPPDRLRSQQFLRRLLTHVLAVAGTLRFNILRVGDRNASLAEVQVTSLNDQLNARALWTQAVHRSLQTTWNRKRLDENHPLESSDDRPSFIDVIIFGLDPKCQPANLWLKPLASTILAQTASWMDDNIARLAVSADERNQSRQKNRKLSKSINWLAMANLAMFLINENDPWFKKR